MFGLHQGSHFWDKVFWCPLLVVLDVWGGQPSQTSQKNETLFHVVSSSKGNIFIEWVDFPILLCWIAHVTVVLRAFWGSHKPVSKSRSLRADKAWQVLFHWSFGLHHCHQGSGNQSDVSMFLLMFTNAACSRSSVGCKWAKKNRSPCSPILIAWSCFAWFTQWMQLGHYVCLQSSSALVSGTNLNRSENWDFRCEGSVRWFLHLGWWLDPPSGSNKESYQATITFRNISWLIYTVLLYILNSDPCRFLLIFFWSSFLSRWFGDVWGGAQNHLVFLQMPKTNRISWAIVLAHHLIFQTHVHFQDLKTISKGGQ